MSRIVKLPKKAEWKAADLTRADFRDSELGFLGSFEEFIPDASTGSGKSNKRKKDNKQKGGDSEIVEPSKKKAKKQKLKKKKKDKQPCVELKPSQEIVDNQEEDESGMEVEDAVDDLIGDQFDDETTEDHQLVDEQISEGEGESESDNTPPIDTSAWDALDLPLAIRKAIQDLRFETPTEIQKLVLPAAIGEGKDILGAAETGSGKTLAFAIPLTNRLLTNPVKSHGPRALIVAPTRELAVQIMKHTKAVTKYTNLKLTHLIGGLAVQKQERLIGQEPDILIATPGRLWELVQQAQPGSYLKDFSSLQCLVIDEMDRMVEDQHFEELAEILSFIKENVEKSQLQTMVFSATLTFVTPNLKKKGDGNRKLSTKEKIQRLIEIADLKKQQKAVIDVTKEFGMAGALVEARINCNDLVEKDTTVVYLLTRYPGRTLIFANSMTAARRLYNLLILLKLDPLLLHADMAQRQRLRSIENFAKVPNSTLIATDVAARGLDIKGVDHVIHYNVPQKAEMYIHRSGRTARALQKGLSIVLVDPKSRDAYRHLCRNLNRSEDLEVFPIDFPELMDALRERMDLADELERINFQRKKIRLKETWFEKAIREADLEEDDTRARERENSAEEMNGMKREEAKIKKQLNIALSQPLPRFDRIDTYKGKYVTAEILDQIAKSKTAPSHALEAFEENREISQQMKKKDKKLLREKEVKIKKLNLKKKFKRSKKKTRANGGSNSNSS